jgi:hypothetical protein
MIKGLVFTAVLTLCIALESGGFGNGRGRS